jgi:crotonobetainyl-CoA:carnitine CoA-transferase CaiB-like acyl-CoA transferase
MMMPLEGIRILESAHQYPGPYCSLLLADMGAEVVKVERPGVGDLARQLPHFFRSINGNKKSLTLDLKSPAARKILYRLVEVSDVFMEGFRPGVAGRIGIDYPTLSKINPRLIYCSISGYGQEGPYRDWPGHDLNYQAMAGMLHCFQDEQGNFVAPGVAIGDLSSGMFAAIGILAALQARHNTGKGQFIDVSMFDGLLSWMTTRLGIFWGTGRFDRDRDAGYGIFRTKDGQFLTLAIAHEDWFWDRLCKAVGLPEYQGIRALERRKRRPELSERMQRVFLGKPRDEWLKVLQEADVPVAPIKSPDEIEQDPHVLFRKMIQEISFASGEKIKQVGFPMKLSDMPDRLRIPPPRLGEHTDEILKSLGYPGKEIEGFKKEGVI